MPVADSSFGAVYSSMEEEFHHYFYARDPRAWGVEVGSQLPKHTLKSVGLSKLCFERADYLVLKQNILYN
jgi:hypothetical protein